MDLNLILAIFWFVLGVGWLITSWIKGDAYLPNIHLGDVTFSPAWLALLLCAYNLARWRLSPRRRARDPLQETLEARRRMHRDEERRGPPDPNFNFTDPAPPAAEPRRTDLPPSAN